VCGPCIGAGDDQEVVGAPGVNRHFDALHRVGHRHDAPSRRVPAFFGHLLIFDLNRLHPSLFVAAHGVAHIDEAAEAGVSIGDQGS
jgi:hypothetical protein